MGNQSNEGDVKLTLGDVKLTLLGYLVI